MDARRSATAGGRSGPVFAPVLFLVACLIRPGWAQFTPAEDLMRELPRDLVERTFALTESAVREVVAGLLTDGEIRAVMARKRLLVLEVQRIIARFGENDVLY